MKIESSGFFFLLIKGSYYAAMVFQKTVDMGEYKNYHANWILPIQLKMYHAKKASTHTVPTYVKGVNMWLDQFFTPVDWHKNMSTNTTQNCIMQ